MTITAERKSAAELVLHIDLTFADYQKEFQKQLNSLRKEMNVPGFRKGQVSVSYVKGRFGREIQRDILEKLFQKSVEEQLKEEGLVMFSRPYLSPADALGQYIDGRPREDRHLIVDITLGVNKAIPFDELKKETLQVPEVHLTDEEFESEFNRMRWRHASFEQINEVPAGGWMAPSGKNDEQDSALYFVLGVRRLGEEPTPEGEEPALRNLRLQAERLLPTYYTELQGKKVGDEWEVHDLRNMIKEEYYEKTKLPYVKEGTQECGTLILTLKEIEQKRQLPLEVESLQKLSIKPELCTDIESTRAHFHTEANERAQMLGLLYSAEKTIYEQFEQWFAPLDKESEIASLIRKDILLGKKEQQEKAAQQNNTTPDTEAPLEVTDQELEEVYKHLQYRAWTGEMILWVNALPDQELLNGKLEEHFRAIHEISSTTFWFRQMLHTIVNVPLFSVDAEQSMSFISQLEPIAKSYQDFVSSLLQNLRYFYSREIEFVPTSWDEFSSVHPHAMYYLGSKEAFIQMQEKITDMVKEKEV